MIYCLPPFLRTTCWIETNLAGPHNEVVNGVTEDSQRMGRQAHAAPNILRVWEINHSSKFILLLCSSFRALNNGWEIYEIHIRALRQLKKKRESSKVVLFWHLRTCKWLLNSFSGDSFTISCAVVVSLPSPSLSLSFSTVSYIISFPLDSLPFHFLHRNVNIPSDFEFQMARPPETRISICLPVDPVQTRARSHKNFFFNLYTFFSLRVVLLVSKSYSGDQGRAI